MPPRPSSSITRYRSSSRVPGRNRPPSMVGAVARPPPALEACPLEGGRRPLDGVAGARAAGAVPVGVSGTSRGTPQRGQNSAPTATASEHAGHWAEAAMADLRGQDIAHHSQTELARPGDQRRRETTRTSRDARQLIVCDQLAAPALDRSRHALESAALGGQGVLHAYGGARLDITRDEPARLQLLEPRRQGLGPDAVRALFQLADA